MSICMMDTNTDEILRDVLIKNSTVSSRGFGAPMTLDDRFSTFSPEYYLAFEKALLFLSYIRKTKRQNLNWSSYTLKHVVEEVFPGLYCSNGTFIVAALYAGFTPRTHKCLGPNCTFNMSVGDIHTFQKLAAIWLSNKTPILKNSFSEGHDWGLELRWETARRECEMFGQANWLGNRIWNKFQNLDKKRTEKTMRELGIDAGDFQETYDPYEDNLYGQN